MRVTWFVAAALIASASLEAAPRRNQGLALLTEAQAAAKAGDMKTALDKAETAARSARDAGDLPALSKILSPLADYRSVVDLAGAEAALVELLEVRAKMPPGDPFELDEARTTIAMLRVGAGGKAALPALRAGVEAMGKSAGTVAQRQKAATAWAFVAQNEIRAGDTQAAVATMQRAKRELERVAEPPLIDVADGFNNLADLFIQQGDFATASELAGRGLIIRRKVEKEDHQDFIDPLGIAADAQMRQGNLAAAEPLLRRAVAIADTATMAQPATVARAYQNLGRYYTQIQRHDLALALFRRGAAVLPADSFEMIMQMHLDAASAAHEMNDAATARTEMTEAIRIARTGKTQPDSLGYVLTLSARMLNADGDRAAARLAADEAVIETDKFYQPGNPRRGDVIGIAAEIRAATGEHPAAARLYDRALTEMGKRAITHPSKIAALAYSAREHLLAGDAPALAYGNARTAADGVAALEIRQAQQAGAGSAPRTHIYDIALDSAWATARAGKR